MKSSFLKIVGIINVIAGLLALVIIIVSSMEEVLGVAIQGEYWVWLYFLVPLFFILIGIYYFRLGSRGNFNKLISASAVLLLIALVFLFLGLIITLGVEFGLLFLGLLSIPASALILIGIILLIIGRIKIKNKSTLAS